MGNKYSFTCKSSYLIYLVTCQTCSAQYVGKTTEPMHKRHTGHRRMIEDQNKASGRHFARCGYNNLSLQIIDCLKEGEDEAIFITEDIWQNRLATFTQHWTINVRDKQIRNTMSTALTFLTSEQLQTFILVCYYKDNDLCGRSQHDNGNYNEQP